MKPAVWRALVLVAIAFVALVAVGDLVNVRNITTIGAQSVPQPGTPFIRLPLDTVDPNSPLDRAGAHKGDVLYREPDTLEGRMQALVVPRILGHRYPFVLERNGVRRTVSITPAPGPRREFIVFWILQVVRWSMLAVALLVALRRADNPQGRALAEFLVAFAFGVAQLLTPLPGPVNLVLYLASGIAIYYAIAQATVFASIFPSPSSRGIRRWVPRFAWIAAVFFSLDIILITFQMVIVGRWPPTIEVQAVTFGYLVYAVAITVAFTIANIEARGADRIRVRWISLSLAAGFSGIVVYVVLLLLGARNLTLEYLQLTLVAIPLGLGYTILRHRVLDIGFVINRALVFTGVSGVVLLSFAILEWAIGRYLVEASHLTSTSLELALALGLGFSLRHIHGYIDRFVDDVFFRDRHRAEAALRRFAHETTYITDLDVLLDRTVAVVDRSMKSTGTRIYLASESGDFVAVRTPLGAVSHVDENDPAIVSMRASRESVELADVDSAFGAGTVYPMLVRGALTGVLACCPKAHEEEYAPDESAALRAVATSVGHAVEALRIEELHRVVAAVLDRGGALAEELRVALGRRGDQPDLGRLVL